nr:hypothetical protein [Tissierella sp.]
MYKNNLALEEYIDSLEIDSFYKFENYIISRQKGDILTFPKNLENIIISSDNMGNYIVSGEIAND